MASLNLILVIVCLVIFDSGLCYNQLYLTKIDSDIAQGRYVSSNDVGISFNSTSASLSISDLLGNQLLTVHEQWIVIQGSLFVQVYINESQGYRDYFVPRYMYKDVYLFPGQLNATVLEFLNSLSSQYHYGNLQTSVEKLVGSPYTDSVKKAVYTLGNELNLYGNNYPSILPLYLVANMLEKLQSSNFNSWNSKCGSRSLTTGDVRDDDCFDECPPCPDEDCLSLCGYGCNCWKWVCGDCCYHLGCYGHDICCRENFIQTKCLFPISFRCESEYDC